MSAVRTCARLAQTTERGGLMPTTTAPRSHRARRAVGVTLLVFLALVIIVMIVSSITPWPSAMLIRSLFERDGTATAESMQQHVPDTPLDERLGVPYDESGDARATMDVFRPAGESRALPGIVWIHGGAWISGSSANVDPYLRILADEGYTTIGVNYALGPEATYPVAVNQLNAALAYIGRNAAELGVDPDRIILAGDSAGANLASQLAALTTNPRYASLMSIDPALAPEQLAGVILNCGVYDLEAMTRIDGLVAWGFQVALWSYTGTKNWAASWQGSTMSTIDFVNPDFPTTYISGGNGDGLTWMQSIPMARALRDEGVAVTEKFWPAQYEPALPHEYQFHLDTPEAQEALTATIQWLRATLDAQP